MTQHDNASVQSQTERRKQLRAAGFAPIPVLGKIPPITKWETKTETNDGEIDIWAKTFPHAKSTGLLTRMMPTLDVDIKNPDAAAAVEALVRERFEDHGVILVRFGNPPKRAIPFRTDTPFKKITVNLIAPDGDEQKLELLANGQQVVGFGIHKDTGKPYKWFGGEPGVVRRGELPAINQTEAQLLVDDAVELLVSEHGYQRAKDRPKKKQRTNGADDHWDEVADDAAVDDWAYLTDNIRMGRDLHESIRDLAAKLIRSEMTAGAAVNLLYGLMDLCTAPHDERWQERRDDIRRQVDTAEDLVADTKTEKAQQQSNAIGATPFIWIDPTKIPLREWLYRPHYIRKFLSALISNGGLGKSSLLIAETLVLVSGKDLLGVGTDGVQYRVWYWNGEDPFDELQRRFAAAIKHFGLTPDDIGDRLFIDNGRMMPICFAEQGRHGTKIATPVIEGVAATLEKNKIDVMIVDPFVSCHRVVENDNGAIDLVAKSWSGIAEKTNSAIMIAHHTRKPMASGNGGNMSIDDGRGAGALLNAARPKRVLNNMSKDEIAKAGIDEKYRRYYFRADSERANLSPPAENAEWFKLVSVDLGNSGMAGVPGDEIGVVTAWEFPTIGISVSIDDIKRVQDLIAAGGQWRRDQRTKERWIGVPIAQALNINITDPTLKTKNKKAIEQRIQDWLIKGLLRIETRADPATKHHESVDFVTAGRPPVPGDAEGF
jgi:hypothetical protein